MTRQFKPAVYTRIKATFAELVELNGGSTDAARRTRLAQPDLSRIGSRNEEHALRMPPVDVTLDLEDACGQPLMTLLMAELNECLLIPLPKGEAGDELTKEAGLTAQRFGQMMADFGASMLEGTMHEREAKTLLLDIRRLMVELARFAETVKVKTGLVVQEEEEETSS